MGDANGPLSVRCRVFDWAMPGLPDWRVAPAHGHDLGAAWLDPLWSKAKKLTTHYSAPSP